MGFPRCPASRRAIARPPGPTPPAPFVALEGFVVSEANGRWGTTIEVPGLGTLNKVGDVEAGSVSCSPARASTAVGGYFNVQGIGPALRCTITTSHRGEPSGTHAEEAGRTTARVRMLC